MICCWCGRAIGTEEEAEAIWGFWAGAWVHLRCFFDYVGDRMVDRRELVERLELGGES